MKAKLDQVMELLDLPRDYEIIIEKERCTLPTAHFYPASGVIKVTGNIPSLVRYALADLILHEIAEDEFNRIEPDYRDDSHFHPDFQALECGWRQLLVDRIADEHG